MCGTDVAVGAQGERACISIGASGCFWREMCLGGNTMEHGFDRGMKTYRKRATDGLVLTSGYFALHFGGGT